MEKDNEYIRMMCGRFEPDEKVWTKTNIDNGFCLITRGRDSTGNEIKAFIDYIDARGAIAVRSRIEWHNSEIGDGFMTTIVGKPLTIIYNRLIDNGPFRVVAPTCAARTLDAMYRANDVLRLTSEKIIEFFGAHGAVPSPLY